MTAYVKFDAFIEDVNHGVHNMASDQLRLALTNVAPAASNAVLADLTEISYTNLSSRDVTLVSSGQTGGVYRLVLADLTLLASGAVPTFRYIVVYNSTPAAGPLIAYTDHGSGITLAASDSIDVDFDGINGLYGMDV